MSQAAVNVLLYRPGDVADIVDRIHNQKPLRVMRPFRPLSWDRIAEIICSPLPKNSPVAKQFAEAWARMAADCLSEHAREVYNALKHGLRVAPGGFELTATATATDKSVMLSSKTSHSYLSLRRIGAHKNHYTVRQTASRPTQGRIRRRFRL
jgi:hypothetical protein